MNHLIHAEFRKIITTKLWWGMLLATVGVTALAAIAQIAGTGVEGNAAVPLGTARGQQAVFATATFGDIFTLVVGIIATSGEYRHLTSRLTFVLEPRRGRVVIAKLITYAALGLLYALAAVLVVLALTIPWLTARHIGINWIRYDLLWVMAGDLATITIITLIGVGVGVVIRNQIAAVIAALAYLLVLGPVIQLIPGVRTVYRWLPGAAADAVTNVGHYNDKLLEPWAGAIVFAAWAIAFTAVGWWTTLRRDVP